MKKQSKVHYRVWTSYPSPKMHYPTRDEYFGPHSEYMVKGLVPDINGTIPYECDIIDNKGNIGILTWNKELLKLEVTWLTQSKKLSKAEFIVAASKIIGNLFENPELVSPK